jgi:hypothetical protein
LPVTGKNCGQEENQEKAQAIVHSIANLIKDWLNLALFFDFSAPKQHDHGQDFGN